MKELGIKKYIGLHVFLMLSSLFGIASKFAAQEQFFSFKFFVYYAIVIANLGVVAILWQQIIKKMPLTTAYANKAVGVIWGIIWGFIFFQEEITIQKITGAVIIIVGVVLMVTVKEEIEEENND